jgi:hypothetical protein
MFPLETRTGLAMETICDWDPAWKVTGVKEFDRNEMT